MKKLENSYNPSSLEEKYYTQWEKHDCFKPRPFDNKPAFSMMMPPPNVTGRLHVGHALNYTLQDILARQKRLQGFDVFWQPGTDHAGIATQMLVERCLLEKGQSRQDLGREKFIDEIWAWKEEKGGAIVAQQRRLGLSCDWSRQRFTMDEELSIAVRKVFVDLYKQGLIYKKKRLVNWDTQFQTAISDLEVDNEDQKSVMVYVRYALEHDSSTYLVVATTRPETIPADVAIAVHPEDSRYKHLIGCKVRVPSTHRVVPIIADTYCDPEKGSGAVKITPAHDFNDFDVGERHQLKSINLLNKDGTLNDQAPLFLQGLCVKKARKAMMDYLHTQECIEKEEPITHPVPIAERSRSVVEPFLADQWFVDVKDMANRALKAVADDDSRFIPHPWVNTYNRWLEDIQPWCISRQIWWGHQIPAWYGPDGSVFVEEDEEAAQQASHLHYGKPVMLTRETDVLDTWFSSALWPFSTLGWPEENDMLNAYYPTSVIVTGLDIIFFWIARMLMMGLHFTDKTPFKDIYIHALVRDEKGQKMSKTKGNVIDPLELMDTFGADATRFALASACVPGRDVRMGEKRVELARNFMTKIYSAAKFLEHYQCFDDEIDVLTLQNDMNAWIIKTFKTMRDKAHRDMDVYRFDDMAGGFYDFFWKHYCDQYLELIKPILSDDTHPHFKETQKTALWIFLRALQWAHPMIPFITEHLWQHFKGEENLLMLTNFEELTLPSAFDGAYEKTQHILTIIQNIRTLRSLYNVSFSEKLTLHVEGDDVVVKANEPILKRLARLDDIHFNTENNGKMGARFISKETNYFLPLKDSIDIEKEKERLLKTLLGVQKEVTSTQARLDNDKFMSNARFEVVEEMKKRLSEKQHYAKQLEEAIKNIARD